MSRSRRKQLAAETLAIVRRGHYTSPSGARVELASAISRARLNTRLYSPDTLTALIVRFTETGSCQTTFEVKNETTLAAARRLAVDRGHPDVLVLNFASAKNPGGGFLNGSEAQEESLARASALYETLNTQPDYYDRNRACGTALYTDHMILSTRVPVFRDDNGTLLEEPYLVSFLTAPAVNAGAVRENNPEQVPRIQPTMARRIEMILALADQQGHRNLVLGAWGCGVFRNEPDAVADLFASFLINDGRFAHRFDTIVFAVLDRTERERVIRPFRARFEHVASAARPSPRTQPGGNA